MFRSHFNLPPVQYSTAQTIKVRRSLLKQKTNEFSKFARTSKHFQKRVNYLDLSSHFSKAIDIKRYEKKGRPKKALKSKTSLKKEKHARKRREVYCQTESRSNNKEVVIESEFTQEHDIQGLYWDMLIIYRLITRHLSGDKDTFLLGLYADKLWLSL